MADTNFDIDQGTNFRLDIELLDGDNLPIDITTSLIIGQVRKTASNKVVQAEFVVEPTNLLLGQFALILSAVATSQLKCNPSNSAQRIPTQFAYDVEVHYTDGTVNRILSGVLNVSPEVTRECPI
jgi:hypothetical protein